MDLIKLPGTHIECRHLIGGAWHSGSGDRLAVASPYTGQEIGSISVADADLVDRTVNSAASAFPEWRKTPIKERSRYLFNLRELLTIHLDELANLTALESGKTHGEARAGIEKGLEVVEFALSLQNMNLGGALEVSRGVRCETRREPLGVVAGIVPFNFPAMVPMWMFPIALALGNCFILKPSEKVPLTMTRMGELIQASGFPKGVFSIVQGDKSTVEHLIQHDAIAAVGFVGSTSVAKHVYRTVTHQGKRCLALGGAKNYNIVVPDADAELTVKGIVDSFTGCAGQRCMAASLMIAVGQVDHLIAKIVARAKDIRLGLQMGAIIDEPARARIIQAIAQAKADGAEILLDGRNQAGPNGYEDGYWLGPTIVDGATTQMQCAQQEIFGPVLTIIRVANLDEAIRLENANSYGNATAIFTTNGHAAQYVADHASNGMVGVNIGVPVPREPFSFGGTKASKFGQGDITGLPALDFWTNHKKITTKWSAQSDQTWMS